LLCKWIQIYMYIFKVWRHLRWRLKLSAWYRLLKSHKHVKSPILRVWHPDVQWCNQSASLLIFSIKFSTFLEIPWKFSNVITRKIVSDKSLQRSIHETFLSFSPKSEELKEFWPFLQSKVFYELKKHSFVSITELVHSSRVSSQFKTIHIITLNIK